MKEDGTADLRPVKTGRTVLQETVILDGVSPGEKVVTNGQSRLIPGAKVIEKKEGASPPVAPPGKPSTGPVGGTPKGAGAAARMSAETYRA